MDEVLASAEEGCVSKGLERKKRAAGEEGLGEEGSGVTSSQGEACPRAALLPLACALAATLALALVCGRLGRGTRLPVISHG
jgi:hypothetical protein